MTKINIWNGGGWNNYTALRTFKTLKVGSRGLAAKQGISKIEICPLDSEKPLGMAANYYDAEGDNFWTQSFDQNDSAEWIRECVFNALNEGIQNRIEASRKKLARAAFVQKISAWRRNFDAKQPASNSIDKLSVKFHAMRRNAASEDFRPSRKLCTNAAWQVCAGQISYADAVAKIIAAGGKF